MKTWRRTVAALVLAGLGWLPRTGSAQKPLNGARVRVTTRLGFHYQGTVSMVDSETIYIALDDTSPETPVKRADIRRLERSTGVLKVHHPPDWVGVLGMVGIAGGTWYGATGWGGGAHAHPRGILGGLLGAFVGAGVAGMALEPWLEHEDYEEQWEKVKLSASTRLVVSPASGGVALGLSISIR